MKITIKYILPAIMLITASTGIFCQETRKSVIVYNFVNMEKTSALQYLSDVIADQIPLKIVENRRFEVSIAPADSEIRDIINTDDEEARNLQLSAIEARADYIIFGSYRKDIVTSEIIISSYTYSSASGKLFKADDINADQGSVFVKNIEPLSVKHYKFIISDADEGSLKMYNRRMYSFLKGTYLETSFGIINFTGDSGKGTRDGYTSSISYIYSFYDAGINRELPLLNVSGFGLKYVSFNTRNSDSNTEIFYGYSNSLSVNYYFFFRPMEFLNFDFYAGPGMSLIRTYNDPEADGTYELVKDYDPMVNAGADVRIIINRLVLTAGAGFSDIFMKERDLTSFTFTAGAGIRF